MSEHKLCNHFEDYWLCPCSQCREQREWQSKTEHPCKFSHYSITGDVSCDYRQTDNSNKMFDSILFKSPPEIQWKWTAS